MIHLLAYLLARRPDGSWSVSSHRNLESVVEEWNIVRLIDEKSSAVVHLGFWRPDTSAFDSACSSNEGKVLLTGAARFALPSSYRSASSPVSILDGLPIYLALSGWGYEIEDPSLQVEKAAAESAPAPHFVIPNQSIGWIETLEKEEPDLFAECSSFNILSESLYQEREVLLSNKSRDRLARYRFRHLSGYDPSRDLMVDGLMFAPPWILRLSIKSMDLPLRARNRLAAIGANAVSDIARIGAGGLMRIEGFGRKCLFDISEAIFKAFDLGSAYCVSNEFRQGQLRLEITATEPEQQKRPKSLDETRVEPLHLDISHEPKSFRDALHSAFSLLNQREASILRQRMGIGGSRKTLEEIAKSYTLTRERVRQIEAKAINRILYKMSVWPGQFRYGIEMMLDGRETPLPLLGLEVLDSWFAEADTLSGPFEYSLEHFIEPPEFDLIRITGQPYVSRLRQDEWEEVERSAKGLMSTWSKKNPPPLESDLRLLIESQLVGKGEELRPLLWEVATRQAHFSMGPSGERILISYGMGAESVVEAVLSESDIPLHYTEIAKRCAMKGRSIDVRRAHNAALNVGYLLGRGIYGLEKHIDLLKEEQERVLGEVEDMLSEAPGRQWHAGEICDELAARGLDFDGRLSKYDLNVILGSSKILTYLRRMVWTARTSGPLGAADRMNIWQAIVSLIQQHGSPMLASNIRGTISKNRGLGAAFQIHQADPLIRVGENEWGILWRDIPFDESNANAIVDEMISILKDKGFGLHFSEIIPSLDVNRDLASKANPILLVSLAVRSEQAKSGKGGYLYISEWEGPRRLTVGEAVEKAFDAFDCGVVTADVAKKASELLGREVVNNAASSVLMKIGVYDSGRGVWFHPDDDAGVMEESTYAVTDESDA